MQETGCYVDGMWGQFSLGNMIDLAKGFGFTLSTDDEKLLATYPTELTADGWDALEGIGDDAEEYLNANHSEGSNRWFWENGDFGYWGEEID